jgi:PknH-like extracellular domain
MVPMHPRKIALSCLALLSLPLALAGCSGSSSGPKSATSSSAAAPSASGASTAGSGSTAGQLTGSKLATLLLPVSALPSGFASSPGTAIDSGAALTTAAAKYSITSLSCNDLVNDFGQSGFGENAMAFNVLANSTNGEIFEEAVYQFATPAAASAFYTGLKDKWPSCGTFTANDGTGDSGNLTVAGASAPSGLGQEDFGLTMKGSSSGTDLAEGTTVALDGADVYAASAGAQSTTVPTDLDQAALMQKLISSVSGS